MPGLRAVGPGQLTSLAPPPSARQDRGVSVSHPASPPSTHFAPLRPCLHLPASSRAGPSPGRSASASHSAPPGFKFAFGPSGRTAGHGSCRLRPRKPAMHCRAGGGNGSGIEPGSAPSPDLAGTGAGSARAARPRQAMASCGPRHWTLRVPAVSCQAHHRGHAV